MSEPAPEIAAQEAAIAAGQDDAPADLNAKTTDADTAPETDEATVAVDRPFYVDSFVASDTLTVDRLGVKIPRDAVADLVLKASESGVTLKVN